MFPLDYHLVTFDRRKVTGDRCLAGDPDAVRNLDSTEVWAGAACARGYRMLKQQQ